MAEWGTENGWANAWNAEPHVICQGAMYVTTNCTCKHNFVKTDLQLNFFKNLPLKVVHKFCNRLHSKWSIQPEMFDLWNYNRICGTLP